VAEALGIPAISTGDMLRQAVAAGSELGKKVEGIMSAGALVDDETMAAVVRERLKEGDAQEGFLLDGYPRTAGQAETLAGILHDAGESLDAVVLLQVPEEELVRRSLARGRADDTEETIRERQRVYREKTTPLIEYYRTHGILKEIDGNRSIDEVKGEILSVLAS
jgi:adenylate kinase